MTAEEPGLETSYAALAALGLFLLVATGATFSSLGIVLPAMVAELHWNWATAGLGFTLLGLACGLASLVPTLLISRIGARWTIGVGASLMTGGILGLWSTHAVGSYLASALATGTGYAIGSTVPATHVINRLFVRRSKALGVYFTFGTLGGAAGPALYLAIAALGQGWRVYWLAVAFLVAACGLLGMLAVPGGRSAADEELPRVPAMPDATGRAWSVGDALRSVQFHLISMAYMTYLLINTAAHSFALAHLGIQHIGSRAVSTMFIAEAAVAAVASAIGGALGETCDPRWLLASALGASALGILALTYAQGAPLMIVYAVGVGVGYGLTFVSSAVLLFLYFGAGASTPLYSTMCLISTIAAAAPLAGGLMRDHFGGFRLFFLICTGLTAVMALAISMMRAPVPALIEAPVPATGNPQEKSA